jgi:hypothetical protein
MCDHPNAIPRIVKSEHHPQVYLDMACIMISDLQEEIRYLRHYGNKDCTAMADAARERKELDT